MGSDAGSNPAPGAASVAGEDTDALARLRAGIDAIDSKLLGLLNERAQICADIGHLKGRGPVYRPEREAQVLDRLAAANDGPLPDAHLRQVFIEIMGACRALEAPLTVAYLGPPGTYSEDAVVRQFGALVARHACATFDDVFREVEAGSAHYGVVPVENSTEGAVGRTLDLLLATPLTVTGEVLLPIHHCLMSNEAGLASVERVYSHSQSLGQCVRWLNQNLPRAERVPVVSNAEA
ncbi:MAG: chorismate mutase, partial [Proteobacteria bacterium]|nr:chorismate mutase [Burkholderiales bacterium]